MIIENVLNIQSFLSILAFHINDIDHDFSAFSFNAAHDKHNNLNFCIYCHFNSVLMEFTDIMCVCLGLFLCSYQYTQQNVPKSSDSLRMKHIKNTRSTTNNHDNYQTNKNTAYDRQYALQIIIKMKTT